MSRGRFAPALIVVVLVAGALGWAAHARLTPPPPAPPPLPTVALDSLVARGERLRAALERLDPPRSAEEAPMRQPRATPYRDHLRLADSLGVGPIRSEGELARLVASRRLVPLVDNHRYVVRVLEHSKPFVTPATAAWLDAACGRFQARLADAGLPPFRPVVSSVLRTADLQADLRRTNRNAAPGRSSHEYAVSIDLDHTDFRSPRDLAPLDLPAKDRQRALADRLARRHADDLARAYWPHLFGVLTRVMAEEQASGRAIVLLESEQPVFHVTVGRLRRGTSSRSAPRPAPDTLAVRRDSL